ncbi:MAG: tetratricopeptide repeat protein [Treponema sp.]|nr:tetratricopeptide repeat protein [Treponema sp.]
MIAVLLAVVVAAFLIVILMFITSHSKKSTGMKRTQNKSSTVIARECLKKLSKDPHNVEALTTLSEVYYTDMNYEKAYPLYETLFNLASVHVEIDQQVVASRLGVCAFHAGKLDDALNGFTGVLRINPKDFDANYYMGRIMYQKEGFEKAIMFFKRALSIRPEATEIFEQMGYSLYHCKKFRESLPYLKKALDEHPENKETLFNFASAMDECSMGDKALKIFMHLRPDPKFGAQSCLACGALHQKMNQLDKAIEDYTIALKLDSLSQENRLTACYKLSQVYLSQHNIVKALSYLKQIQTIVPNYKDVNTLVQRYQELNQNSNLQAYLMSGTSDFVALCRKFVAGYYADSFVKIEDVSVATESIEVLCSVESARWSDTELFRFFRSSGAIGELYIRDFHAKIKDLRCDRGFCVTAGSFTEEARKYVENRPIDLIEKSKLVAVLKKIS